jgi:hypothetical protein
MLSKSDTNVIHIVQDDIIATSSSVSNTRQNYSHPPVPANPVLQRSRSTQDFTRSASFSYGHNNNALSARNVRLNQLQQRVGGNFLRNLYQLLFRYLRNNSNSIRPPRIRHSTVPSPTNRSTIINRRLRSVCRRQPLND